MVVDRVVQRTPDGHQRYLLGRGKMKDVLIQTLHRGADMVIFDQTLSPAQLRAISEMTDIKVIDRTQLILDIFARRAHSREGQSPGGTRAIAVSASTIIRERHPTLAAGWRNRHSGAGRNQTGNGSSPCARPHHAFRTRTDTVWTPARPTSIQTRSAWASRRFARGLYERRQVHIAECADQQSCLSPK